MPCLPGLMPDEMFVVGEGLDGYYLYGAEARIDQGRALITFGLDLLSGHPEGTCILDGLIRYARSDAFNPKGKTALSSLYTAPNGWQKTLTSGDSENDNQDTTALPAFASNADHTPPSQAIASSFFRKWEIIFPRLTPTFSRNL